MAQLSGNALGDMAQSQIHGSYMVEGENWFLQDVL